MRSSERHLKCPYVRFKASSLEEKRKNKKKDKWQRSEPDERKEWQRGFSATGAACPQDFMKPVATSRCGEPSGIRRAALDELPAPLFVWFLWCFNVLCLNCVLQKGGLASWLRLWAVRGGKERVVRMNIHGTVTETSTSPDLRVILDFSHLVERTWMLSRSNPELRF